MGKQDSGCQTEQPSQCTLLQWRGFSDPENLDRILDLIDEYVDLKESMMSDAV